MAASSGKKSSQAAKKAAATRSLKKQEERRRREITGILLIAGGLLLGIYMFISYQGILGEWLSRILFGLCGTICYLLPVVLMGFGYMQIKGSASPAIKNSGWFFVLGVLALMMLGQAIHNAPYENVRYMPFVQEAYQTGSVSHVGGGFVGAVLIYPILLFGGKALVYILCIAMLLIAIIAITNLSVKDVSEKVTGSVHHAAEKVRAGAAEERRLYRENMEEASRKPREKMAIYSAQQDVVPQEKSVPQPGVKKGKRKAKTLSDQLDDALSMMPLEGSLKRVSGSLSDLDSEQDVPLNIRPLSRKEQDVSDDPFASPEELESLFGQQLTAPLENVPQKTGKKKATARVTDYAPQKQEAESLPEIVPEEPGAYVPPSFSLLDAPRLTYTKAGQSPQEKGKLLVDTLQSFGITAKIVDISVGPVLTRYELQPAPGVRVSRITNLANDIALNLAAPRVRIEAPIPGKAAIGIEVPNDSAATVVLRDIVESKEFRNATSPITLAFGKDISGKVVTADLGKMPHLLIAGSTGSGKSVCINDLIISMVYKASPQDLRLILIDPKMVELSNFSTLPHLLIPVVTEPKKASGALRWAVNEMMKRYKAFSERGAREITRYNSILPEGEEKLPKIVVIIDELADLMMVAPDEVEDAICRIAQLGRAAGIHLIVATQRPSADVITGLIKANIPSRCAFAVSSGIDSRIILDTTGAEKLLGKGDMLFHMNGASKPTRLQCAFVSDEEVERIVDYFRVQARTPSFDESITEAVDAAAVGGATGGPLGDGNQEDELMQEALRVVIEAKQASTSLLQRRLRVGYARGSRLLDSMEQAGYVSEQEGTKPRRVLITRSQYEEIFGVALPPPEKQVP